MSFKAKFKAGSTEYNVLDCKYHLFQEVDDTGRPSSVTRGGSITLTLESTNDTALFEWMCDHFGLKDGSVVFTKRDSEATMKELKFTNAYMVAYAEKFTASTDAPMNMTVTLSAREITLGNGTHTNEWPDAGGSNGGR